MLFLYSLKGCDCSDRHFNLIQQVSLVDIITGIGVFGFETLSNLGVFWTLDDLSKSAIPIFCDWCVYSPV